MVRKFVQAAGRLDTSFSPSLPHTKIQSQLFHISQLVGVFFATFLVAQCPYNLALLGILTAAFVTPLTSQFFVPATPILFYLLLTRCMRSIQALSLPPVITPPSSNVLDSLQFSLFPNTFHVIIAFFLWLSHYTKILHVYATAIGCMNSVALLSLLVLPNLWPEYSDARSLAFMDGTNALFVALTLWHYSSISRTLSYLGVSLCCSFLLARHYTDIILVVFGGGLAVSSFFFFFPDRIQEDITLAAEPVLVLCPSQEQAEKHFDIKPVTELLVKNLDVTEIESLTSTQLMPQSSAESLSPFSLHFKAPIPKLPPTPVATGVLSYVPINPHKFNDAIFEEIALLGKSSTRTLHQVRHKRTGAVYVRKSITPRELPIEQIRKELHPLRALKHVNIVRCLGIYGGEYGDGDLKVVLEYQAGGNLGSIGSRIKQMGGVMEENVVGRITEGILQGLAYLHNLQIVHRDIKPANVLLSRDGVVKLSEFVPSGESVNKFGDTFFNFVPYTAPERVSGAHYTDRVDIWSMGITLIECIQNRRPYPEHLEAVGLMLYITDNSIPSPCLDAVGIWSDSMRAFMSKILVKDPSSRPGATELLRDPWIIGVMQKDARVDVWLQRVWNWPRLT